MRNKMTLYTRVLRLLKDKFYKESCNFGCKALLCGKWKPLVEKSMRGLMIVLPDGLV